MIFKQTLAILLFLFMSMTTQAQTDTAYDSIMKTDCEHSKVFTKVEVKPSLKITGEAYGDSLISYLRSKNVVIKNAKIPCYFILTSKSQILEFTIANGANTTWMTVKDAILHFNYLLKPAVQNSLLVCSYIRFIVVFEDDKVHVDILQ